MHTTIVVQTNTKNQSFSHSSHNCPEIAILIQQKRLTDCLECLEQHGYTQERAILMLAYLQGGAR